jgi:hypothetical protein
VTDHAWPPGAATGIGSLPGVDFAEALRLVLGELPDLPHLPELPDRGYGAAMIGRSAALLAELPVEIQPSGWQLTARPGRDLRRAKDFLARDLDILEEQAGGVSGAFKIQVTGPWTLAASIELPSGHRIVTDHGATRDLVESLVEGVAAHLADVARRLPRATILLQLDEPSLPAVLTGQVPTPSGYGSVRSVEESVVETALHDVLATADPAGRIVHCCADEVPITLLRRAGASAVAVDLSRLGIRANDALGESVEAGVSLWLGVLPGQDGPVSLDLVREPIRRLWGELGFPPEQLAGAVVPTPACGLAGASPAHVRRVLSALRDAGRSFVES